MHKTLLLVLALMLGGASLSGCQDDEQDTPTPDTNAAPSTLVANSVTPAAGTKLSASSTIDAELNYALAENLRTDYTYSVTTQFETTTAGTTIGAGSTSTAVLPNRSGEINVSAPLTQLWNDARLKHPVTVYFYLVSQAPGSNSSVVIAKTGGYNYTE